MAAHEKTTAEKGPSTRPHGGRSSWTLWWHWVLATAAGELVGFAVPGSLAPLVIWAMAGVKGPWPACALLVATVLAGVVEGASLGLGQWLVLRQHVRRMTGDEWVLATALAAGLAYVLGMAPSTLADLTGTTTPVPIGVAVLLGVLLLPSIGFAQWLVLRRYLPRAGWWVPGNALAWLAGLAVPMVTLTSIPDQSKLLTWILAGVASGALMGLVVGAITGVVLIWLLPGCPAEQ